MRIEPKVSSSTTYELVLTWEEVRDLLLALRFNEPGPRVQAFKRLLREALEEIPVP